MSSKSSPANEQPWMDLSPAARYLGVHYTTLRRWADSGKIPCARTPGGRRRFFQQDLDTFLRRMHGTEAAPDLSQSPNEEDARVMISQDIRLHARQADQTWLGNLNEAQLMRFRYSGRLMLGLLMQYNSRPQGGEIYVQEAEAVMRDYGQIFQQQGFSLADTTRAFLFFRHSIVEMIFDTSLSDGPRDGEGQRLFRRTNEFLDAMLLAVLEGFSTPASTTLSQPE